MDLSKAALRAAARNSRDPDAMAAEDARRLRHFLGWLPPAPGILAVYVGVPGEPDTSGLIDAARERGWEVRAPILGRSPDWARFDGWDGLRPAWRGIPEPTGTRLGAQSLAEADIVVASCLAVDEEGYRLGVGGGWYDRALLHRRSDAVVVAWARDAEVVPRLPREPFDVPVDHWCTETGMHSPLGTQPPPAAAPGPSV